MATLSLTTHFAVSIADPRGAPSITGASTTSADRSRLEHDYEQRDTIGTGTLGGRVSYQRVRTYFDLYPMRILSAPDGLGWISNLASPVSL